MTDLDHQIDESSERIDNGKTLIEERMPEPVLRGTDIPVHVVAALACGQSTAEIVEDYPILTAAQVKAAVEYAKVFPRTGVPLPTRSFKRMLGDLAELGVWDLESDPPPMAPRAIP